MNRTPDGAARQGTTASVPGGIPSITLPKGGGALRSIDEKFSVNAANGTCELSVPLGFSKTRSGLDSGLSLHYSSGAGNGPFGLGWALTLPTIQRRTDRQLPRYFDAIESDVFLFAGSEDLVPGFVADSSGTWIADVTAMAGVRVTRYRPRIERDFARIEKIEIQGEVGCFWKVTSRENIVTIFGRTAVARLTDPADPRRTFRWLPEWMYDDTGNCVEFVYKDEDLVNVPASVEEQNRRAGIAPVANKYLKRIRYGNQNPYHPSNVAPFSPAPPANPGYFYETVFDYGEHADPTVGAADAQSWPCRFDSFSDYRAGFEIRTYRLCRRILFFHFFAELNQAPGPGLTPCLVRSLDLAYRQFKFDAAPRRREEVDLLSSIRRVHYKRTAANAYESKGLPAVDLTYHDAQWNTTIETVSQEDVANAPAGARPAYQWTDLDGFGVPGLLTEQGVGWYYKSNLGAGHFGRAALVAPKPSLAGLASGALQLQDLEADGRMQVVSWTKGLEGCIELSDAGNWGPFRAFDQIPIVDLNDPATRFFDLDGDGRPEIVVSEEQAFCWFRSRGTDGYAAAERAAKPFDEEQGPAIVFADSSETIFIADMTGDGLSDIVRVRHAGICYWPNLGYGKFGAKVTMAAAPTLDRFERFEPRAVRLVDISGTGAADLIYLGDGGFTAWFNLAGNGWSDPHRIDPFPSTGRPNAVFVLDLLGNGTASLVWSSELPANTGSPLRYVDLMGGRKPFVLFGFQNNLGLNVDIEYKSSSAYALLDRQEGHPWLTRLPFPVMCVSRAETRDAVSGARFVREFRYRHGCFDHGEREFRGFGMVEERDTEEYERFSQSGASNVVDNSLHQPPRRIRTWYHTGAYFQDAGLAIRFREDYFENPTALEYPLPDQPIESDGPLTPDECRQAARACKGTVLRQEMFADDGSADAAIPFSTMSHSCRVRRLQPTENQRHAVFVQHECETISYQYERNSIDPRISHDLNLVVDEFGHIVESASVVYGRQAADGAAPTEVQVEQGHRRVRYTVNRYTNDVDTDRSWRVRQLCETRSYELSGITPAGQYFTPDELTGAFVSAVPLAYQKSPTPLRREKRLLSHQRTLFAQDASPDAALPLERLESLGLHFEDYRLAFTSSLRTDLYGTLVSDAMLTEGGYLDGDAHLSAGLFPPTDDARQWWAASGTVRYPVNPDQHFFLPERYIDPHGTATRVRYYSTYHLLIDRIEDALLNATDVLTFDWRFLQPVEIRDINDNLAEARFDTLGLVVGTALKGKGGEADDLTNFSADPTPKEIADFLQDPVVNGPTLLAHATSRFVYDFSTAPAVAASISRETHVQAALAARVSSPIQYAFEYSDGLGRVAMKKVQAEPGKARRYDVHADGTFAVTEVDTTPNRRWCGTGRVVQNNKGNPVMAFEPYFSVTHRYESAKELVETGVTPVMMYDVLDRLVRTDFPDGSFSTARFGAWRHQSFDRNDNVLASGWYSARSGGAQGPDEQDAAQKAAVHDGTPDTSYFDSLGRMVCNEHYNRYRDRTSGAIREERPRTLASLDIDGNRLRITDARGNVVTSYEYDLLGQMGHSSSMDAGERVILRDVARQPLYTWDSKGSRFHASYDLLRRPVVDDVLPQGGVAVVLGRREYGSNKVPNQNGRLLNQYDSSGSVTHTRYDFKGNLQESSRRFTTSHDAVVDWTNPATVPRQPPESTTVVHDALDRVARRVTPDGSVSVPRYSEASLLTGVDVGIRGGALRSFVGRIVHDAKGQRQRIEYGNGVATDFTYDPLTFRLRRLLTMRATDGAVLQDLQYTYDPVGNITRIADRAQQTLFFNNQKIPPLNDYTYDATYRLVVAAGREHVGQNAPVSQFDEVRTGQAHPADGTAAQNYRQEYEYDLAGNMTAMTHSAGVGAFVQRWTRQFTNAAASNRLLASSAGGSSDTYVYDAHGNLTALPGFGSLDLDVADRLAGVDLGGGGTAFYTYDASRMRTRKIVERQGGGVEERLYFGALERFTRSGGAGAAITRETVHVMDGQRRLAFVDSRTAGSDGSPAEAIRYQLANHLGSAALELDESGQIISYEEYYPYGSTSLQSVDASRGVSAKRYRYTARERDEETGLYYHGARYYAPWLARWISADPTGTKDGLNVFSHCRSNPVTFLDPSGTRRIKFTEEDVRRFPEAHTVVGRPTVAPVSFDMSNEEGLVWRRPETYWEKYRRNEAIFNKGRSAARGIDLIGKGVFAVTGLALGFVGALAGGLSLTASALGVGGGLAGGEAAAHVAKKSLPRRMDPNTRDFFVGLLSMVGGFAGATATGAFGNRIAPPRGLSSGGPSAPGPGRLELQTDYEGGFALRFSKVELKAAMWRAAEGKNVTLREAPKGASRGAGTSDLVVEGVQEDIYTPTSTNPRSIAASVADKGNQASSVLVDLSRTTVTREQLGGDAGLLSLVRAQFGKPVENINEVHIIDTRILDIIEAFRVLSGRN
jgi:RHS repeat-associated protein